MENTTSYDIIGDIHGHLAPLEALLTKLGYQRRSGAWQHSTRKAVFVGDFIDRGPNQVAVVQTARAMVDAGNAIAVMGNHELNASAYFHVDPHTGKPLRRHDDENRKQHGAFLAEVEGTPLHAELIGWFLTLPLWLDLPGLQVVHACWHPSSMRYLSGRLQDRRLPLELLAEATLEPADGSKPAPGTTLFGAVEALTKGIEVPLPEGVVFQDHGGRERRHARVPWWKADATYRDSLGVDDAARSQLPQTPLPDHAVAGMQREKPVLFGHYWMSGVPTVAGPLATCIDYSIAQKGLLCAYRFDGEPTLETGRLVSVA